MKVFGKLASAFALLAVAFTACSKKNDGTTVRIGVLTGHSVPVVAKEKGYFAKEGLENIEIYVFGAGPAEIEAFTSGNLDIINTGDLPAYNGIINGLNLRFIGSYSSTVKGNALIVRDDANIKTFSDLAGKRLAVPFGTNIQSLAYEYLAAGGLTQDDATVINLGCADAINALRSGDTDAAVVWQPWIELIRKEKGITVVSYTEDFRNFVCPISASVSYLDEHPETVKKVLSAFNNAAKWITQNKEEAAKITADYYQIDDPTSILIGLQTGDVSTKLTDEKVKAIKLGAVKNYEFGIIKQEIDVDKYLRQDLTADLD